jgi:hypothetical protein
MRCEHCNKKVVYMPSPVFDCDYRHKKSWSIHCFDGKGSLATPKTKNKKKDA